MEASAPGLSSLVSLQGKLCGQRGAAAHTKALPSSEPCCCRRASSRDPPSSASMSGAAGGRAAFGPNTERRMERAAREGAATAVPGPGIRDNISPHTPPPRRTVANCSSRRSSFPGHLAPLASSSGLPGWEHTGQISRSSAEAPSTSNLHFQGAVGSQMPEHEAPGISRCHGDG